MTGIMHQVGDVMMHRNWTAGGSIIFFPLQALGITFEMFLGSYVPKALPPWMRRTIGYAWVLAWFTWCAPIYIDPLLQGGLLDNGPRFNLTLWLWKGEWIPHTVLWPSDLSRPSMVEQ
ncbi:hypothetical protein V5O48_000592 [Marasmius crinis-equi]|uniref:Wax synthase domain-containing protein n=1 Tax=Marasmius crinis-equi TaxID=585013 RepID=A0ABR3G145_9AGAR